MPATPFNQTQVLIKRIEGSEDFADSTPIEASGKSTADDVDLSGKTLKPGSHFVISGAGGDDTITGSAARDILLGDEGNDTLNGGRGADLLHGGIGDDRLFGGSDNDKLYGGIGNDFMSGDQGDDTLYGGLGNDTMLGGAGSDTIHGDEGNDTADGGDGNDWIAGGQGNDTLNGGYGFDTLNGGDGNDVLNGGFDDDVLNGGLGSDTLTGGARGADRFVIDHLDVTVDTTSPLGCQFIAHPDTITDFDPRGGDKLDLVGLFDEMAPHITSAAQAFAEGYLYLVVSKTSTGVVTTVYFDQNGNAGGHQAGTDSFEIAHLQGLTQDKVPTASFLV